LDGEVVELEGSILSCPSRLQRISGKLDCFEESSVLFCGYDITLVSETSEESRVLFHNCDPYLINKNQIRIPVAVSKIE
jgi:hypothetical protein